LQNNGSIVLEHIRAAAVLRHYHWYSYL